MISFSEGLISHALDHPGGFHWGSRALVSIGGGKFSHSSSTVVGIK